MGDHYSNNPPYTPPPAGNPYQSGQHPYQPQHLAPQGQSYYPPAPHLQMPPQAISRDFYSSPIPPNCQLAPYQPDPRRPSSAHAGQPPYGYRGSPGPLIPYFEPPPREPLPREPSLPLDRGGHGRHRSRSRPRHSRPPLAKGEKPGGGIQELGKNLVWVAGGGYLGNKLGGGLGTVVGAALGYVAHKAEKDRNERHSRGGDDGTTEPSGSRHRRSRRGSAPAPLGGHLYPPDEGRSRRHSRRARSRSRSRRRYDSTSSDSSNEDDHRRRRR